MHRNHLEGLLKYRLQDSTSRVSVDLMSPRICNSSKLPGDAAVDTADPPGPDFENPGFILVSDLAGNIYH